VFQAKIVISRPLNGFKNWSIHTLNMSFWNRIFGKNIGDTVNEPKVRFGRFSDSYKAKSQYEAWDKALDNYDANEYLAAYRAFFQYLRDDKEDNVRWLEENGGIRFEILQGSKRVTGFADARQLKAEARIAHANELSVAFMRRLVETNYSLDYSRYALDDEDNLVVKFETSTLDGSPYKLYYALKEVAVNADKQDDLLLEEFESMLTPLDMGSKKEIPLSEKEVKYNFIKEKIQKAFQILDNGTLNLEKYPSGVSYILLSLSYCLDYLTAPEGYLMEAVERIHRHYYDNDGKNISQKNIAIRKELDKILARDKELIFNELYATTSCFGILAPNGHDTFVSLIDNELSNMDWYESNQHIDIALAVPSHIVGSALFNYALPKPTKDLLELYYRILEPQYFKALGFETFYDEQKNIFNDKNIKTAIRKIVDEAKEKYPNISPDLALLDFRNPCRFARTYLLMIKNLNVIAKT
jgi:hypothetical protein